MHRSHGLGQHAVAPPASAAPGALILGGAHGSLAVARSLGRRGIPVFFLTHDHPIAKFSRYATHHHSWLGPNQNGGLQQLLAFGRNGHSGWVLIPGGDAEVEFVARHHDALSQVFCATMPLWEVVKWACDKRLTYARAASLGIPCPRTVYPKDRRELAALDLTFPLILKPMVRDQVNEFTSAKAWRADSKQELLRRYDRAAALVPPETIALQELIPGGSESQFSYAAVCVAGTPVASLVARRTRQLRSSSNTMRASACSNSWISMPGRGPGLVSAPRLASICPGSSGRRPQAKR